MTNRETDNGHGWLAAVDAMPGGLPTPEKGKRKFVPLIPLETTDRGFRIGYFEADGSKCVIQESSSAREPRIWLGLTGPMPPRAVHMHLSQAEVASLLPLLVCFARTGKLVPEKEGEDA